jgi:hypothetical protein
MNPQFAREANKPRVSLAPGDQVLRYVGGQPFFCTVVGIEGGGRVSVSCNLWPTGYSALVTVQDVALVSRGGMSAGL